MPDYVCHTPAKSRLEPGVYPVRVKNAVDKLSKHGNEMIELTIVPVSGGPELRDHLVFTPKAHWKIDVFLTAVGIPLNDGELISVEPEKLIGKTGEVCIDVEEVNGNKYNRIDYWVLPEAAEEKGFERPTSEPKEEEEDDILF